VAISPNGQILASGSTDTTIKIWHLATGELLNTLTDHLGSVNSVAISPNGQILASGSADTTIKIWRCD
jgi:WD40 repeat protein